MKSKVQELDAINLDLRKSVATLEEKVAKEELDKLVRLLILGMYKNYVIKITPLSDCFSISTLYFPFPCLTTRMQLIVIEEKKRQGLLLRSW